MPTRERVYAFNPDNIEIGPARVFIADYDETEPPTQLADFVSLTTYDAASGWTSLGDTVEPVSSTFAWDTVEVRTEQHGRVTDYIGDYNNRIVTTFAERSAAVKAAVMGIDLTEQTNAQSESVTYYTITKQKRPRRLAVLHLDETIASPFRIMATIFPKVMRTGSDSEWSWGNEQQVFPAEWNVYPDEDIQDPETGEYVFAYDLDQP